MGETVFATLGRTTKLGIPEAEMVRLLEVTTPAIAKALKPAGSKQVYLVNNVPLITRPVITLSYHQIIHLLS